MLQRIWVLCVLFLASFFCGCSTKVATDYDPSFVFSNLHQYAWLEKPISVKRDPVLYNALTDQRIRRAVDNDLLQRGFKRVEMSKADFLVTYHLSVQQKLDVNAINASYGFAVPHGGAMLSSGIDVDQYEEGQLLIDVLSAKTRGLIWRGSVKRRISDYAKPQQREANIHKDVAAILAEFPPH